MIRIILVDDHKLVRDGIRAQLSDNPKYHIVAEASDGKEALQVIEENETDIVIMDINMDGMDGITCTEHISKEYPHLKVLALTMLSEKQHIKQMLKAGAAGYLLKNCEDDELKNAINSVFDNGTYYSPEVTKIVMASYNHQNKKTGKTRVFQVPLTRREKEVLQLILKERTNKEIAEELFISVRTVDTHKRNLLEKTGSKNVAGLVLYTINNQILDDF